MHSYVRLLSFSWLALDRLSHLSSFQSDEVSFGAHRSGQHFLFRLDFRLLLPLQGLLTMPQEAPASRRGQCNCKQFDSLLILQPLWA